MKKAAVLSLLATGKAFVQPTAQQRTPSPVRAVNAPLDLVHSHQAALIGQYLEDAVSEPLDVVREHHNSLWEEFVDSSKTPIDLVSTFHAGLSREYHTTHVSQLRSSWGHAG
jgi:hypothetical protein